MKHQIKTLNQVSVQTPEGRLLMAALAKLTALTYRTKTPDEVLEILNEVADGMYPDQSYKEPEHVLQLPSSGKVTAEMLQVVKLEVDDLYKKLHGLKQQQRPASDQVFHYLEKAMIKLGGSNAYILLALDFLKSKK